MTGTLLLVILCVFVTSHSVYDKTFKHFQWMKQVLRRAPKPWITYIDKLLSVNTKKSSKFCSTKILMDLYSFITPFVHANKRHTFVSLRYKEGSRNVKHLTHKIMKPAGILIFRSDPTEEYSVSNIMYIACSITCHFLTDQNLRLNFTFTYFNIKDTFRLCYRAYVSVDSNNMNRFLKNKYCGRLSQFSHYSAFRNTSALIIFQAELKVEVDLSYTVFPDRVVSNLELPKDHKLELISLHHIGNLNISLFTFYVSIVKYQQICYFINPNQTNDYTIIDGPLLGRDNIILTLPHVKTCLSSFQFILQLYNRTQSNYWSCDVIKYWGVNKLTKEIYVSNETIALDNS